MPENISRREFLERAVTRVGEAAAVTATGTALALGVSPSRVHGEGAPWHEPEAAFEFFQSPLRVYELDIWTEMAGGPDGLGYRVEGPILEHYKRNGGELSRFGAPRSTQFQIDDTSWGQLFENSLVVAKDLGDGNFTVEEPPVKRILEEQGFNTSKYQKVWQMLMASHYLVPPWAFIPETENGPVYSYQDRPFPAQIDGEHITVYNIGAKRGLTSLSLEAFDEYIASQGVDHISVFVADFAVELPVKLRAIGNIAKGWADLASKTEASFDYWTCTEIPPPLINHPETTERDLRQLEIDIHGPITGSIGTVAWLQSPFPLPSVRERDFNSEANKRLGDFLRPNGANNFSALHLAPSLVT